MSKKQNHKNNRQSNHADRKTAPRGGLHRKWWFWIAVGLMLAGMFMYVASDDESIQPGGEMTGESVPAAP